MENAIELDQKITIQDRLNQHPNSYRYLLLDPLKSVSIINPLHLQQLQDAPEVRTIYTVLRGDLPHSPQHCPLLVLLAYPGEHCEFSWLASSEDYARSEMLQEKRYLCGWLCSTTAPEQLASELAERFNNLIENTVTPFFEPLRFELLQVMEPDGLATCLWPVNHWWYMTSTGNICVQTGKVAEEKWVPASDTALTQQEIPGIFSLLQAWQLVRPVLPMDAAINAANTWLNIEETGHFEKENRNFLSLCHLTLAVDIEQHPAVRALLEQVIANPSLRLSRLVSALPDAVWDELEKSDKTSAA